MRLCGFFVILRQAKTAGDLWDHLTSGQVTCHFAITANLVNFEPGFAWQFNSPPPIMKTINRARIALAACVTLFSPGRVLSQDWPQWRGPHRDGKLSDFIAPQNWPKELKQQWKATVGVGDATPALVGDKLYVFARQGNEEIALCLNAANGKEVWTNRKLRIDRLQTQ